MKKTISLVVMLLVLPIALAEVEITLPISISAGNNNPQIKILEHNIYDHIGGTPITRTSNYAFTGEILYYKVNTTDSDGANDIKDAYISMGGSVSCNLEYSGINWKTYDCYYAIQPSSHGDYELVVTVTDNYGATDSTSLINYFLNPIATLDISDTLTIPKGTAGSTKTSNIITITNQGEGGITLNMKIKGKDFYDSSSSGAICPTSNQLALTNFKYYSEIGGFNTGSYLTIPYTYQEVILGHSGLSAGNSMELTLQLTYPTPCIGSYSGGITVFGEVF